MNLNPLYDLKARLEQAAIAGTGLLEEDFRLKKAAESMKPLAAASPVFAKISAGVEKLLAAPPEERGGLLLDLLALADAVAYTQGKTGADGALDPLPARGGTMQPISYGQLQPLLTALTSSGGGRLETVRAVWEDHPEFFTDYRILPALVAGLGDSFGEMAQQNQTILERIGPVALPLLRRDFDPAGKKEMARRVEIIAALEGPKAAPWLREVLPEAKKDVRPAIIAALGRNPGSEDFLLELSKTEKGKNREAVLQALARLDGETVQVFWTAETAKKPEAVKFLEVSRADWASDLAAGALQKGLESMFAKKQRAATVDRLGLESGRRACMGKSSPAMLDAWRWMDDHLNNSEQMKGASGTLMNLSGEVTHWLLDSLCAAGPGPLAELCLELWEKHRGQSRYLSHSLLAALMTWEAGAVYDEFSPYILRSAPMKGMEQTRSLHNAVLEGLNRVRRDKDTREYRIGGRWPTARPLDIRWLDCLTRSAWKTTGRKMGTSPYAYWESVEEYDVILLRLADPADDAVRDLMVPYLRRRMDETGQIYSYSHYLFRFSGSPRGVIGGAMVLRPDANRLGVLWSLLNEAAKHLPAEEVAAIMEEMLASKGIQKDAQVNAERIFPWTAEQLRAGKPFPTWENWTSNF